MVIGKSRSDVRRIYDNLTWMKQNLGRELGADLQKSMDDMRKYLMLAVKDGKVPSTPEVAGAGIDMPGSAQCRRTAAKNMVRYTTYSKGQSFALNHGEYYGRKSEGRLKIRGTQISARKEPLGILTGGLFQSVASGSYKCKVLYARGAGGKFAGGGGPWSGGKVSTFALDLIIDGPFYFETVHDGDPTKNILERPFVHAIWDVWLNQDIWIKTVRFGDKALDLDTTAGIYQMRLSFA